MKTRHFILIGLTILLWFSFRFLLPLTLPFVLAYFFAKMETESQYFFSCFFYAVDIRWI